MLVTTKDLPGKSGAEIRCINFVDDPGKSRFGLICNKWLMNTNSEGEAAGIITCNAQGCKAKYEIAGGKISMVERLDFETKKVINIKRK